MRTTLLAIGIWGVAFGSVVSARQDPAQQAPSRASTPAQTTAEATTTSGEFDFGGRGTSITGDVARYNRFRDLSDGLFFDNFSTKVQKKGWYYDFGGTHAGRQDAVYTGEVTLPGRLTFMGSYQAVPWNISSAATTKTIFANTGTSVLTIPDYVQSLLQTSSSNISQVVPNNLTPIALQAHRKYSQGGVEFMVDPNTTLDFHVLRMDRGGTIVGEGTFGFSSAQELPLPVIQHQTDMNAGAERAKGDWLFRVGLSGVVVLERGPVDHLGQPVQADGRDESQLERAIGAGAQQLHADVQRHGGRQAGASLAIGGHDVLRHAER